MLIVGADAGHIGQAGGEGCGGFFGGLGLEDQEEGRRRKVKTGNVVHTWLASR